MLTELRADSREAQKYRPQGLAHTGGGHSRAVLGSGKKEQLSIYANPSDYVKCPLLPKTGFGGYVGVGESSKHKKIIKKL